ncbi:hypothetical protein KA005_03805, partial [bacterium]|nr:hypothetical protein [bacterium]
MGYSTEYKKRAIDLNKNRTAKETLAILAREYNVQPPIERTLARWENDERLTMPSDQQIQQPNNELLTTRKEWLLREHFEQMALIAKTLLGGLDIVDYKGEDNYEIVKSKALTVSLSRDEVVEKLKENAYRAQVEFRSMGLFQYFLTHLEGEDRSCRELDRYIEEHP